MLKEVTFHKGTVICDNYCDNKDHCPIASSHDYGHTVDPIIEKKEVYDFEYQEFKLKYFCNDFE
jgi:hypothetical protein